MSLNSKRSGRPRLSRREFVQSSLVGSALAAVEMSVRSAPENQPFELQEVGLAELQEGLRSGKYTSRRLVELYLERIDALDKRGPAVNSILEINPDALSIAESLDTERKGGHVRGPLHGIPLVIKDNIETADRMRTSAGSLALADAVAAKDAFLVGRLRAAGVVLLGKTNLSEWANFRSTHSSSGWSARGGQCRNPYALDRSPSGSSSGSGVAVAASFAAAAVGTETDGSIVSPSSANSIVGIKPTLGLISRAGIIPIAHSQDTAGPMARTVRDAAILLGAMVGADAQDPITGDSRARAHADYTSFLDAAGLRGARIGVPRTKLFGYSRETDRLIDAAIEAMKSAGAVIVDPANIPTAGKFDDSEFEVLLYEFKADLNRYLGTLAPSMKHRTLKELIQFNNEHAASELPYFGQEVFEMAQKKGGLSTGAYRKALAKNHLLSRKKGIDEVMERHRLDALAAPTSGPPWLIDLVNGDSGTGGSSSLAAVAGYPGVTVPAGYVRDLPVGISFFGRAFSEPTLLRLAYAFEQATKHRRPPRFLSSAAVPYSGRPRPQAPK